MGCWTKSPAKIAASSKEQIKATVVTLSTVSEMYLGVLNMHTKKVIMKVIYLSAFAYYVRAHCLAFWIQYTRLQHNEIGVVAAATTTEREREKKAIGKLPKIKSHRLYQHLIEINEADEKKSTKCELSAKNTQTKCISMRINSLNTCELSVFLHGIRMLESCTKRQKSNQKNTHNRKKNRETTN